jgi:signal peptidase I
VRRRLPLIGGVLGALVGAVVVAAIVAFFALSELYQIHSSAMEPTLRCDEPAAGCTGETPDRVTALRFVGPIEPNRGDVVAFDTPPQAERECGAGRTFVLAEFVIKRIVVLPGETWRVENGVVFVNGRELVEPYLPQERRGFDTQPPRRVPPDSYVLLGDNRAHSCDSRVFGPVRRGDLIGEVVAVYWPPTRWGFR